MKNETIYPYELSQGWVWVTLKEIGANDKNAIVDGPFGSNLKVSDYIEGNTGVPVLTTKNLEYGYDKKHLRYISQEKFERLRRSEVRSGDILVAKIGSCGKTGVYPCNMPSAMIPANLLKMTVNSLIERMYVYYLLNSPFFRGELEKITTATAQPAFNVSKFRSLYLPLCPCDEQYRIVAKIEELFTRLDAGLEALKKIRAQLKRYRQAVLKSAFEGKLTAEWRQVQQHELEPATVLLARIKQERLKTAKGKYKELPLLDTADLPQLPDGWVYTALGEVVEPSDEKIDPATAQNMPYIGLEHIEKDTGKLLGNGHANDVRSTKARFYTGDLLYGRLRPYLNKVHVADFDGVCSTDILVFPKREYASNRFLSFLLLQPEFVKYASQNMSGVQHPRVTFNILSLFTIPLPSLPEQHCIVAEIEHRFCIVDQIEKTVDHSLKQSERLRQSILKRAFEGKLVSQNPNDEPAEKLLERIKAERARELAETKATSKGKKKAYKKQMRLI